MQEVPQTEKNSLLSTFSLWSSKTIKVLVEVDPRYYRPTEVELLMGDYSKAKRELGWEPKVKFEELVKIIVKADWEKVKVKGY